MRILHAGLVLTAALMAPSLALADFSYQETTQVTGGALVSMMHAVSAFSSQARQVTEPAVSSLYLKGNRLARESPESIEIIDLDMRTITNIDKMNRSYTVMTFDQMAQQAQHVLQQVKGQSAQTQPATSGNGDKVNVSFDAHVRKTDAVKQVSGVDTSEAILTLVMNATDTTSGQSGAMGVTNDMWLAPAIPGYEQVSDFYRRMGEQMGSAFAGNPAPSSVDYSSMLQGRPGAKEAMSQLAVEMRKVQGVPVLQVTRMGTTANGQPLPAASEAPLPAQPATPSAGDVAGSAASSAASSAIASRLGALGGAFGGFGHKKAAPPPAQTPDNPAGSPGSGQPPSSAVLIESQTEMSNFSTAPVDEAHFQIPAGYKQVQPPNR